MKSHMGVCAWALLLLLAQTAYAKEQSATTEAPEPPPAPLVLPEAASPAPKAPAVEPQSSAVPIAQPPRPASDPARPYLIAGYSGAAITLALVATGTTLGLLAQNRADDLTRTAAQLSTPRPIVFDQYARQNYLDIQAQGRTFNQAAIACFVIGGVTAVLSGVLFWDAAARAPKSASLALLPAPTSEGVVLSTLGRF